MRNATLITLLVLTAATTVAQNTWIGGAPGHETDWMDARNWTRQRVPEWNDNVLIPHLWHHNYPKVSTNVPAIAHLEVEGGAQLNITSEGHLLIDGRNTHNSGVLLIGNIVNEGSLAINSTALEAIDGKRHNLANRNNGQFTTNGHLVAYEFGAGH